MGRKINILISSVGGQGGLSLSRMIAEASRLAGYSIATGETLGMAQRFGSVKSFVRVGIGEKVYSPIFHKNEANYMLCLEIIECARNLEYLDTLLGWIILSYDFRPPVSASLLPSKEKIDSSLLLRRILSYSGERAVLIDPKEVREISGSSRAINASILGAFVEISKIFDDSHALTAIELVLRNQKAVESSRKAYIFGKSLKGIGDAYSPRRLI
ncbi:MAG: 2-oxoacid:acceptor oxidoreductase family protein [Fervidicoccaceae archaeon]